MEEKNQTVVMTETEKAEFDAFRQAKAKKVAEEKARADREMYKQMVDEEIERSIPVLLGISERIKESKRTVMENFKTILEMKSDLFKTKAKDDQRSHTFTNSGKQAYHVGRVCDRRLPRYGGGRNCHCEGVYRKPRQGRKDQGAGEHGSPPVGT